MTNTITITIPDELKVRLMTETNKSKLIQMLLREHYEKTAPDENDLKIKRTEELIALKQTELMQIKQAQEMKVKNLQEREEKEKEREQQEEERQLQKKIEIMATWICNRSDISQMKAIELAEESISTGYGRTRILEFLETKGYVFKDNKLNKIGEDKEEQPTASLKT